MDNRAGPLREHPRQERPVQSDGRQQVQVEGDEEEFRFEVRTTLMHELGHYLGLDEEELDERGLL